MLQQKFPDLPIDIDANKLDQTNTYFNGLLEGTSINSMNIKPYIHTSFQNLTNALSSIETGNTSVELSSVATSYNSILTNWYNNIDLTQLTNTEKTQIDAFYSTAQKSPTYWQKYIETNNINIQNASYYGRFRFLHWLGVAIMDAGGAFIGGFGGPIGSVALGVGASLLAVAIGNE